MVGTLRHPELEKTEMTFWLPTPVQKGKLDKHSFQLTAQLAACVGTPERQFFMGGVAMAAAVEALQMATGKPLLWATMQFLSHGLLGDKIEIDVEIHGGRAVQQTSAAVKTGDRMMQNVMAALGGRDHPLEQQFVSMPEVPPAQDCPIKGDDAFGQEGNLLRQFERRTAFEDTQNGIEYMWIKPTFNTEMSAPLLALMADFFLGAHVATRQGTSLDNTFRLHTIKASEWVLNATSLSALGNGAAHGTAYQFAEDGTLLATSGQTGLLPRL